MRIRRDTNYKERRCVFEVYIPTWTGGSEALIATGDLESVKNRLKKTLYDIQRAQTNLDAEVDPIKHEPLSKEAKIDSNKK